MSAPISFDTFKAESQFVRFAGSRTLYVQHGGLTGPLYSFTEQRGGKITAQPDDILRAIHAQHVIPAGQFMEKLDRDLRAVGAKR